MDVKYQALKLKKYLQSHQSIRKNQFSLQFE